MIQFLTISTNFKVSLLHEGTSEIGKEYFIGCYTPELKDGIYAVTTALKS